MKLACLLSFLVLGSSAAFAADPAAPPAAPPPAPPAAGPVVYKLDPGQSQIYVQVFKDPSTLAAGLSHDHVIAAKGWSGTFTFDAANPAACKGELSVPVAQLENDKADLRKKVGYDTQLDDSARAEVKEHMLDDEQLDAKKYPTINLKISSCSGTGSNITVNAALTLHGQSKTLAVPMSLSASPGELSAKGTFKVNHTDFGMEPFSAMLGQLKNLNELKFTVQVKGKP